MGKKRIIEKSGGELNMDKARRGIKGGKKKYPTGVFAVHATYNNTKAIVTSPNGGTIAWSSSGALGFRGAKKGTPFAAAKVGEIVGEKASALGMKDAHVVVRGVGSGRESAIRGFTSKGINILSIKDKTPVPHNGPRAPKPRRV